jgi:choline monooxygenase
VGVQGYGSEPGVGLMVAMQQTSLDSVKVPVSKAKGLPNQHYISQSMYQQEKQDVLFNNWSGIGFGKDVPEAGDALPVDFMGMR